NRQHVLHLTIAEPLDLRIVGWTFGSAVPAPVVVGAVSVVLTVALIVLLAVRDEIVQGKAVMTRDEVDTGFRFAPFVPVDFRTTDQSVGQAPDRSLVATEKAPHIVTKASIPFLPGVSDERPDLIQPGRIPGFGDQLRSCEGRLRFDVPEHRRMRQRMAGRI